MIPDHIKALQARGATRLNATALQGAGDRGLQVCQSKKRYRSFSSARNSAIGSIEEKKQRLPELFIYRCPICGGWHLSKQNIGAFGRVSLVMTDGRARVRVRLLKSWPLL